MATRISLISRLMAGLALILSGLMGCAERDEGPRPPADTPADASSPLSPADAFEPIAPAPLPISTGRDEDDALRDLKALSAWDAVVERSRLLGRRAQQGVVYGRLGAPIDTHDGSHQRWLIDETEGEGALAIRVAFDPERVVLEDGQRLAVWGAWWVDGQGRWYWRSTRMARLAPAADELPLSPGFDLPTIAEAPADAVPISELTSSGDIVFEVRAPPRDPTDGWDAFDPGGKRPAARLILPGERPAYGGQDYRTADEHWQFVPGALYTVPARRFRHSRAGELPLVRARGVPRRIPP